MGASDVDRNLVLQPVGISADSEGDTDSEYRWCKLKWHNISSVDGWGVFKFLSSNNDSLYGRGPGLEEKLEREQIQKSEDELRSQSFVGA
jgi:hypothetical protein